MRNPLEAWRQRRAKQRYMPRVERPVTGRTTKVAGVVLVLIIGMAALLELGRGRGSETELVEYVQAGGESALELIESAARTHRLIFLADIPGAVAPKRLAAQAITRVAQVSGLDLVVLEVDAEEQPFIDQYLATAPEDASILLSRPRAIREGEGLANAYLDIYRTVWRVNQELGAARRIRIIAADLPGWPPNRAVSPADAARLFGRRTDHMAESVLERLGRDPSARVLFFVDGLQALRSGAGRVQTGGATPVEVGWLAARIGERYPSDVYSILVDAPRSTSVGVDVAAYSGTEYADILGRGGVSTSTAVPITAVFDEAVRTPIRTTSATGLTFTLEPRDLQATGLADAYVYLGR